MLHHQFIRSGNNEKETLVMVHGLQSSLESFLPLVPRLGPHFHLLLVDQRGHGGSPPSGDDYTVEAMARDLKELLDQLNIKKVFLLGHSMGGRTAAAFTGLYPEMVKKLIIEDIGIEQRQPHSPERDKEKALLAKNAYVSSLFFKSKEDIYQIIAPLYSYAKDLLKNKVVEHAPDKFELKFWPDVSVLYGHQGNTSDLTPYLSSTDVPVMFLIADFAVGSAMNEASIENIKRHVPRAKLVYFQRAWHNIHKSDTQKFCNEVLQWLLPGDEAGKKAEENSRDELVPLK